MKYPQDFIDFMSTGSHAVLNMVDVHEHYLVRNAPYTGHELASLALLFRQEREARLDAYMMQPINLLGELHRIAVERVAISRRARRRLARREAVHA